MSQCSFRSNKNARPREAVYRSATKIDILVYLSKRVHRRNKLRNKPDFNGLIFSNRSSWVTHYSKSKDLENFTNSLTFILRHRSNETNHGFAIQYVRFVWRNLQVCEPDSVLHFPKTVTIDKHCFVLRCFWVAEVQSTDNCDNQSEQLLTYDSNDRNQTGA